MRPTTTQVAKEDLGLGSIGFAEVRAPIDEIGAADWLIVEQESRSLCFAPLKVWSPV